ncbi:hypothetical protein JCM10449v2_006045 [Rhodotorula kratochvilovae]
MSPDHKRRRVDHHDVAGGLPHAVPPIAVSAAPPSPPSPPLSSVSALALFAAEMVAWLWFAPSGTSAHGAGAGATAGAAAPVDSSGVTKLQVRPSDRFVRFCQEVLSTTQVSESVVLLALLFISRLKQRNAINGAQGSEYRLAVTGLMLANKILDDNTYTAQTWSQVSSLELGPLVAGEAEFLRGLDWSLHVTGRDFEAWRKLLDGQVAARNARIGRLPAPSAGLSASARRLSSNTRVRDGAKQGDLRGLGIEGAPPQLPSSPRVPAADDSVVGGTLRRPRGRLGAAASTNTTPTSAFATFTFGAPASAPHPQQLSSAPLPQYQSSTAADPPRNPLDVSPTAIAFYRRNSGYRASAPSAMPGIKRNADDAFAAEPFVAPALPPHVQPHPQGYMARSYSAGPAGPTGAAAAHPVSAQAASTPIPPAFFLHPAHQVAPIPWALSSSPHNSRPSSSSSASGHPPPPPYYSFDPPAPPTDFSTLSDAFSPRYEPDQHRRLRQASMSLGYYSLASGHGLGHLRQTLPPPPSMAMSYAPYGLYAPPYAPPVFAPPYPMAFSASSSPTAPPPFEAFAHPYPTPTPSLAYYPGMAAPPMAHSTSQFAPPPPPRAQGHRRTSSGHSARGGGLSPAALTSTPQGLQAYSPPVPLGAPYAFPPAFLPPPPPPPPQQQQQQQAPPPPPGYYSAYSNAGLPGVYFRG